MQRYSKVKLIIDELLGEEKTTINILKLEITEDDEFEQTFVQTKFETNNEYSGIHGAGEGFVDAMVASFVEHFQEEYPSLENFYLSRYEVKARIKKKLIGEVKQTDASVEVEIGIQVPAGEEILFSSKDVSLVRATTKVVRDAIQFMINCEKAAHTARFCLQQAKTSGRVEVVEKYIGYLSTLVKIASYDKAFN